MLKKLVILSLISTVALAHEGMWMPKQLPEISRQLKKAGIKLNPKNLTKLTDFPMGAVVSLGGCSASFVSEQGLVVTNHHCVYGSLGYNSKEGSDLIKNGFLAKKLNEELPARPGTRVFVTKQVTEVTDKVVTPAVAELGGKERVDAIENNRKALVSECEKDEGHRCSVSSFYGGLEYYMIKQLEIRDVRLVYAPPAGVGKFGGDTDNWMWPRHTGDFGYYRAYVSKDGKAADYAKDNVPYTPKHILKLADKGVKEGDFVMLLGYPGRTSRHRLPSEVEYTFEWSYPNFVQSAQDEIDIVARETKKNPDAKIKYASYVAGRNNYLKNRKGMIASYEKSDLLDKKTKEHKELKAWVDKRKTRRDNFAKPIQEIEKLLEKRDERAQKNYNRVRAVPRLLRLTNALYRLANEKLKPDTERKAGYQERDIQFFEAALEGVERSYDPTVDRALVKYFATRYLAQPKADRNKIFDKAMGLSDGMKEKDIDKALLKMYKGSKLGDAKEREKWLNSTPEQFQSSNDSFIKLAVALYEDRLKEEEKAETLGGDIGKAYRSYMKAKLAFMKSKGKAVYPDANSTLRVTFGKVKGRKPGADGTNWTAFTTLRGVLAKATGEGEFNAPKAELDAIKAKNYGKYYDKRIDSVPVNFLATLDITGGNSGSATLNAKGELVGLAFDGTLDSIISDWDFNEKMTRTINVDIRYMLWQMKYIDKATNLLTEMGI